LKGPARKWKVAPTFSTRAKAVFFRGDAAEFMRSIPDKTVSLVVTSPPYNIGKAYETRVPLSDYLAIQARYISEFHRILADDGSICWQVGSYINNKEVVPLDILFHNVFSLMGFKLRNRIIWHYRHGLHAKNRFSGRYESILWYTKTDQYVFNLDQVRVAARYPGKRYHKGPKKGQPSANPLGANPSDFWARVKEDWEMGMWDIPNVKANHPEKTIQPCQFPVELVQRCVLALTDPGDWVLDPYAGVASTLIGALMHDRRALGSEKERAYHRIGLARLAAWRDGDLSVRPINRPVYEPTGTERVARLPDEWKALPKKVTRSKSKGRSARQ
jgi:adenine-specific DNA-methyltransferase